MSGKHVHYVLTNTRNGEIVAAVVINKLAHTDCNVHVLKTKLANVNEIGSRIQKQKLNINLSLQLYVNFVYRFDV
jgi:hypothetical protein